MSTTIQFKRARGNHQIPDMSNIIIKLLNNGWSDVQICGYLGMELDEVIRLKQISELQEAFTNHTFSKSWIEFERNIEKRICNTHILLINYNYL